MDSTCLFCAAHPTFTNGVASVMFLYVFMISIGMGSHRDNTRRLGVVRPGPEERVS